MTLQKSNFNVGERVWVVAVTGDRFTSDCGGPGKATVIGLEVHPIYDDWPPLVKVRTDLGRVYTFYQTDVFKMDPLDQLAELG